jgi:hypothetical protein
MFVAGLDPIPNRCPISQWLENQQKVNFSLTTFKPPPRYADLDIEVQVHPMQKKPGYSFAQDGAVQSA